MRRISTLVMIVVAALTMPGRALALDCPTTAQFTPAETGSSADTGWTGIGLQRPIFGNVLNLGIVCASGVPPCGACDIIDVLPDPAGTFQRCTDDTSIRCTVATEVADCGAVDRCRIFLTVPQSVAVGGVGACYTNEITSDATGSVDVESGAMTVSLAYTGRLFGIGGATQACPKCVGDPVLNDGLLGGVCTNGARNGLPCDGNAPPPPLYDDIGTSSFDCPPNPGNFIANLNPGPVTFSTATQTRTLDAASPDCSGASGGKCFCDTCNTLAAEPCQSNADCPLSGGNPGICGGRRCVEGPNDGAPCAVPSECPMGTCRRAGEPTQPNGCYDDTATPTNEAFDCTDTGPVGDGIGECPNGPVGKICANHPNRGCVTDADCDAVPGACTSQNRSCFTNNGTIGQTMSAIGVATPPVANVSTPTTLGMITCQSTSRVSSVDAILGLPGLARNHHLGALTFDAADIVSVCPAFPDTCRAPVTPGKSGLKLKDQSPDTKDKLRWRWAKGAATTLAELGNPIAGDDYALCLYDHIGLRASMVVPGSGNCDGHPCWKATSKGFIYKRKDGAPRGITKLIMKSGEAGKAQMQIDGKGDALPLPSLLSLEAPLQVQLRNNASGLCWGVTYDAPFTSQTATDLKAID